MRYEISIEVLDADFPASSWQRAYGDLLIATALEHGGTEWRLVERPWGVVLEIAFSSERWYQRWRDVPAVGSAFDAVPDPVNGLIFHRGWVAHRGAESLGVRVPSLVRARPSCRCRSRTRTSMSLSA